MIFQSNWLLSLFFILSATASADLKRRDSALSTTTAPYPTANGTYAITSSIDPTSSILPSVSSDPTSSTPKATPTSSAFYLVVADTGTPWDGDYLYVAQDFAGDGLYVLLFGDKVPDPLGGSVFFLSDATYGNLTHLQAGYIATYFDLYGAIIFQDPDPFALSLNGETPATCELSDGVVLCQNTAYSAFFAFPQEEVDGALTNPYVELGPFPIPQGSYQLTLLPVPVE